MKTQKLPKGATKEDVIKTIAREFADGAFQRAIQDLPYEIQYRTQVSWGAALTYANEIRLGKIR